MTENRVRYLLENRSIIMSNIRRAREIIQETDSEIIEALSAPAVKYGDKIQSVSDERLTSIIHRLPVEKRISNYDSTKLTALIDAQEAELEQIDYQVFCLPLELQEIILTRYFDCHTNKQSKELLHMSVESIHRHVRRAISIIAKNIDTP